MASPRLQLPIGYIFMLVMIWLGSNTQLTGHMVLAKEQDRPKVRCFDQISGNSQHRIHTRELLCTLDRRSFYRGAEEYFNTCRAHLSCTRQDR